MESNAIAETEATNAAQESLASDLERCGYFVEKKGEKLLVTEGEARTGPMLHITVESERVAIKTRVFGMPMMLSYLIITTLVIHWWSDMNSYGDHGLVSSIWEYGWGALLMSFLVVDLARVITLRIGVGQVIARRLT